MMTPKFLILFCSFFITCTAQAQFDSSFVNKNIRQCADSLTHGFRTRNWDLFARYTNPALIGTLGGKKEFVDYISQVFSQSPDYAWKKYKAGSILQMVQKGRDLQAVIELNTVIEWEGNRISTTSHLVGESWDGGLFWTFFDSQGDREATKKIHPNLSDELIIPKREEKKEPLNPSKSKN